MQNGLIKLRNLADARDHETQVVIVGAGLAGLAAAQRLHESGLKDVMLVEAQGRVGGRVHTVEHSDFVLELGAQWLHGAEGNPLFDWLSEKNLLNDHEQADLSLTGLYCSSSGTQLDSKLVANFLQLAMDTKSSMFNMSELNESDADKALSAAHVLCRDLKLKLAQYSDLAKLNDSQMTQLGDLLEWFLRVESIENGCDSMQEVSMASYTDWTDFNDGDTLNFRLGYRSLLDWFCTAIPISKCLSLNTEVSRIEMLTKSQQDDCWLDESGNKFSRPMLIRCKQLNNTKPGDDAPISGTIQCDHVLVTCSLGFLKKNMDSMFKPALPEQKQQLIRSLGFGTVNKILLHFEAPFWLPDYGIKLIWQDKQLVGSPFPSWAFDIIAFDAVRKQPNVLVGWIGGHGSRQMELESDKTIGDTCLAILDHFLPPNYAKPTRLLAAYATRWHSNQYTCGSYSFRSLQSRSLRIEKLHEPVYNTLNVLGRLSLSSSSRQPRILFAGEATAGKLYSTTHGAIVSGWREADRLTDSLQARLAN